MKVEKRYIISKTSPTFPPPQKMLGLSGETNIPKNSKAIIMLALYPGKCLLHHKGIENDETIFLPRHSAKREVCFESMTKFSSIQFLYETLLYRGNAILEILHSKLKTNH